MSGLLIFAVVCAAVYIFRQPLAILFAVILYVAAILAIVHAVHG